MTKTHPVDTVRRPAQTPAGQLLAASALALALSPPWASAQTPAGNAPAAAAAPTGTGAAWAPLGADAVLRAEIARTVRPAFFGDDHTWSGDQPLELRPNRTYPELLMLDGSKGDRFAVFQKSWLQVMRPTDAPATPTPVHDSTRPAGALSPGQKWTSKMVSELPPVDWCNDTRGQIEGDFEVGKPQAYRLTVNGQPQTLEVLPVVERGKWTRCASGKRYTRTLYAPSLDAVLSAEFITYRTSGQPHEASFRLQVKEIVGAQSN